MAHDDPEDLDDILDRALEEFEEEEMAKISAESAGSAGLKNAGGVSADKLLAEQHAATVTEELHKMIANLEDPEHAEVVTTEGGGRETGRPCTFSIATRKTDRWSALQAVAVCDLSVP